MIKITICIVLLTMLIPVSFAFAHGQGQSLEQQVGDYSVHVDYPGEGKMLSGQGSRFQFQLVDKKTTQPAQFTRVWVKVSQGTQVLVSTDVPFPSFGLPWLTYSFPSGGDYQLTVRYYNNDQDLAEAIFPLSVKSDGYRIDMKSGGISEAIGLLLGLGLGWLFSPRKPNINT
jgi:hypothetical protein